MQAKPLNDIFYNNIEKLCSKKCPLELSLEYKKTQITYNSQFLLFPSDMENSFIIDYLRPNMPDNDILL